MSIIEFGGDIIEMLKKLISYGLYLVRTILALKYVSEYLENGFYKLNHNHLIKGVGVLGVPIYSKKKASVLGTNATIYWGEWTKKVVFVLEKVVFSFYDNRGVRWNQNIREKYSEFLYPKVEYLEFDKKNRFNISKRVYGTIHTDKYHVEILAKDIIRNNAKQRISYDVAYQQGEMLSSIGIHNLISILQHGDASPYNVIWIDTDVYQYIDLDTVGLKPFLYDFFKIWLIHFREDAIPEYVNGVFDEQLWFFFESNGISVENLEYEKDKYLAAFIIYSDQYWNTSSIDFSCLPENYCLTNKVLKFFRDK